MLVGVVEALLSVTVKSSGEPSAATASLILATRGRSSVSPWVPSSLMVVVTRAVPSAAWLGLSSTTEKVSLPSKTASSMTVRVTVRVVSPGAKVTSCWSAGICV